MPPEGTQAQLPGPPDGIEETLDILSDPDALRQIQESEASIARGEYVTLEEVRREYGL